MLLQGHAQRLRGRRPQQREPAEPSMISTFSGNKKHCRIWNHLTAQYLSACSQHRHPAKPGKGDVGAQARCMASSSGSWERRIALSRVQGRHAPDVQRAQQGAHERADLRGGNAAVLQRGAHASNRRRRRAAALQAGRLRMPTKRIAVTRQSLESQAPTMPGSIW